MQKVFAPFAAAALVTLCAFPAHAEKWLWFPVKGGAVAYDDDSRKTDLKAGSIAANTVIFYDKPKSAGALTYSFIAERLEFECRTDRHRWSQSAILDLDGAIVTEREDGVWTPLGPEMGSTAMFKRILCMAQTPPDQKEAKDLEALIKVVRAAAPKIDLAPDAATGPAPKAAATAPKAGVVKLTPAGPVLAPPPAKTAATKAPAPIDLDALASGPDATKELAPKAPAAKTVVPAAKTPPAKAPAAKAPTAPAPKLRPLSE